MRTILHSSASKNFDRDKLLTVTLLLLFTVRMMSLRDKNHPMKMMTMKTTTMQTATTVVRQMVYLQNLLKKLRVIRDRMAVLRFLWES